MKGLDLGKIDFGMWFIDRTLPKHRILALVESCRQVITGHCIDAIGDTRGITLRITPEHWFDPDLGGTLPAGRYMVRGASLPDKHNGRVSGAINVIDVAQCCSVLLLHFTIDS